MDDEIIIKITPQERNLLLKSFFINPGLIQRLKIAEIKGKQITVKYSPQELEELVEFIAAEANHAEDKSIEKNGTVFMKNYQISWTFYKLGTLKANNHAINPTGQ